MSETKGRKIVLITGDKNTGKTSLLKYLEGYNFESYYCEKYGIDLIKTKDESKKIETNDYEYVFMDAGSFTKKNKHKEKSDNNIMSKIQKNDVIQCIIFVIRSYYDRVGIQYVLPTLNAIVNLFKDTVEFQINSVLLISNSTPKNLSHQQLMRIDHHYELFIQDSFDYLIKQHYNNEILKNKIENIKKYFDSNKSRLIHIDICSKIPYRDLILHLIKKSNPISPDFLNNIWK